MKPSMGKGGIHRYMHKGGNCGKIQDMGDHHHFIVCKVALLGVSENCVKKIQPLPCCKEYIYT